MTNTVHPIFARILDSFSGERDEQMEKAMRTRTINGIIIHTSFDYPPVPWRGDDWHAITDNYDGAPDAGWQPVGRGATEQEAIDDLLEQIAEHEGD